MHVYHGNYEKYVQQKEERRATLMAAYKNQRDRIEALEAFINRFRYQATKAKQVQSRIKELEKIERIEVPEEEATIHFTHPAAARIGPHGDRGVAPVEGLSDARSGWKAGRREARARRPELPDRARRADCAGGGERRGQIHSHPPAQRP